MMHLETRWATSGTPCKTKVVSRVAGDEAIVIPVRPMTPGRKSVYIFNGSGTRLWAMVEEGRSGADMAAFLQTEYGLCAEEALSDTEGFLGELASEGLIELA